MKRVLIITYYWPPSAGSGVQRWLKMSKYLPEFGWQPVIYTPENPDFSTKDESLFKDIHPEVEVVKNKIWEPYRMYRLLTGKKSGGGNFGMTKSDNQGVMQKFSMWVRGNIFVPDPRVTWRKPSILFLKKYLKKHPVDAIVTTGPPQSMHLIGLGLKKSNPKLKWIADFRDPWSKFDFLDNFDLSESAKKKQSDLESEVLNFADRVVTVSPSLGDELVDFDKSKRRIVNNGFDHKDFENIASSNTDTFQIYHAGLINAYRYFPNLWKALDELVSENQDFKNKVKVELVGNVAGTIQEKLNSFSKLKNHIRVRSWMAHDELLKEYGKANLLLLLPHQSINAKGIIPGKVYEYLALKKPILNFGPSNTDVAKILEETQTGTTLSGASVDEIKTQLMKVFLDFKSKKTFNPYSEKINQYSRKNLAEKFSTVLEEIA